MWQKQMWLYSFCTCCGCVFLQCFYVGYLLSMKTIWSQSHAVISRYTNVTLSVFFTYNSRNMTQRHLKHIIHKDHNHSWIWLTRCLLLTSKSWLVFLHLHTIAHQRSVLCLCDGYRMICGSLFSSPLGFVHSTHFSWYCKCFPIFTNPSLVSAEA